MKNILVVTPFYPLTIQKRITSDTKAIYYLLSNKKEDENVIVLFYYQHRRLNAIKSIPRLLKKTSYDKIVFKDDYNNDVLFCECPYFIPKYFKPLSFFNKKYLSTSI